MTREERYILEGYALMWPEWEKFSKLARMDFTPAPDTEDLRYIWAHRDDRKHSLPKGV